MRRLFLTGDTHADIDIEKLHIFNKEHPELTKEDLVIVLGDFGVIWDELDESTYSLIDQYEGFNFSTAFVLGNHEGYDLLETFPKEEWSGGKVRRISNSIVQLENSEIYSINGKDFFVMGGAESIDKAYRITGISWWKQEIPNQKCRYNAIQNLLTYSLSHKGNLPDYILTHTPPARIIEEMHPHNHLKIDEYATWLNYFLTVDSYYGSVGEWYCGHMHEDVEIENPYLKSLGEDCAVKSVRVMYNNILEI